MDSFPRQYARTRQFRLGEPRSFTVSPDGARVVFLRSRAGDDPVHCLWVHDVTSSEERCVADPVTLGASDEEEIPQEERARRERVRESAGGIVAYAVDGAVRVAAFALGGRLWVSDLEGAARRLDVAGPVVDPRVDPTGQRVAYVLQRALHVADLSAPEPRLLVGEGDPDVSWGLAEFVAAEEMARTRGFWWSPDGRRLAVARVDVSSVIRWHVADAASPANPPAVLRYPAAGTANAEVTLAVVGLDGTLVDVEWDQAAFPYLVMARWGTEGPLTLVVQSRNQRTVRILAADPDTGATRVAQEDTDLCWVDLVGGVPRWLEGGRLVTTVTADDTRRVAVDGVPVSPPGLQVRGVVHADKGGIVVTASAEDPTAVSVWRVPVDGGDPEPLAQTSGVTYAVGNDKGLVLVAQDLDRHGARTTVHGVSGKSTICSCPETPLLTPRVELLQLGARALRGALVLPRDWEPGQGPLPVLLDPYGGPHAQRVLRSRHAYLVPQWFAEAGFAVLVADGRGTPGRGYDWERAVAGDLAGPPLADQIDALQAAVKMRPDALDPTRVAIRGWSFGGFLAALAVLRRPDVFHAAIAGAPVTDWALYDTHYTERYLGLPQEQPEAYQRSSLLDDAPRLERPLLLIHGLADDNVVAAHTLRLSRALLEAGRPHTVLPLSGVTHMTPQEQVAENLLLLQLDFLRRALRP
ncbi:MAG: prolyl oligopeptidase family serine peptidase [Egibacteraceae bacterium]